MIIQTQQDTATLLERISKAEQDLYARRHLVAVRSSALVQNTRKRMRYSLTSPVMLILAAGTGFVAQRWVKRNFSRSPEEVELRLQKRMTKHEHKLAAAKKKKASGNHSGLIAQGLKVIALLRTFIAALPSNWVNSLPGILRTKAATPKNVSIQPQAPTQMPAQSQGPTQARYNGASIKDR